MKTQQQSQPVLDENSDTSFESVIKCFPPFKFSNPFERGYELINFEIIEKDYQKQELVKQIP